MTSNVDEPVAYPVAVPLYVPKGRLARFIVRSWERSPHWAGVAAVTACVGGAVAYTLIADPVNSAANLPPTCLVKLTTGFDCPGCGGTRAAWYLLHGNLALAARHHAIFVFAVPFLLYGYVAWAANTALRWKVPMLRPSPIVIGIFLSAWVFFAVLRNLPWAPFTWLYV